MKSNYYQTMENAESHLLAMGYTAFEKMDGSSSTGFIYTVDMNDVNCLCNLRIDKNVDAAILEVYPGISVPEPYYPMTATYCQNHAPSLGSLQISLNHGGVYFHMESLFKDAPTSSETFLRMEQAAARALNEHYHVLQGISHGVISPLLEELASSTYCPSPDHTTQASNQYYSDSLHSIEQHLCNHSNHNSIARNLNPEGSVEFLCEVLTSKGCYSLEISLDCTTDFLTMCAYPGARNIKIPTPYCCMAAQYCTEASDKKKVGYLHIGDEKKGACAYISTSFADAAISGATVEQLEHVLLPLLHHHEEDLDLISYGCLLRKETKKESSTNSPLKDLLDRLQVPSDDDDDEPQQPESEVGSFPDFLSFLAAHQDFDDSEDEDEEGV